METDCRNHPSLLFPYAHKSTLRVSSKGKKGEGKMGYYPLLLWMDATTKMKASSAPQERKGLFL